MSIKFTIDTLKLYCLEQKITLTENYVKINEKTIIKGVCLNNCGEFFEKSFRCLIVYSGGYCKSCTKINTQEKTKKTNLEKYGCENVFSNNDIKNKIRQTTLEKYGETHYLKSNIGKTNYKQSINKKYGVDNISQSDIIKLKNKIHV